MSVNIIRHSQRIHRHIEMPKNDSIRSCPDNKYWHTCVFGQVGQNWLPLTMSLTHNTINFWHFQALANFLTAPNIVFILMFEIYGVGPPTESQCDCSYLSIIHRNERMNETIIYILQLTLFTIYEEKRVHHLYKMHCCQSKFSADVRYQ